MTEESTTDDQSEQKADFAARAEKIRGISPKLAGELAELLANDPPGHRAEFVSKAQKVHGIGPELAGELAEEFADELTADRNGTPDNDVELPAAQAGAPVNEVKDVEAATENEKDRWNARRLAMIGGAVTIVVALIPVVVGLLKDDPPPPPVGVDQETLVELMKPVLGQSSAEGTEQLKDELRAAFERTLRGAEAGDARAKEAIEAIRRSGDTAKLLAVLEHEADQKLAASVDEDFLELCREIAAVAFLRGDIDAALVRVELVLMARPDDLYALTMRGWIHHLHGELDDAIRCHKTILELTSNDNPFYACALGNLGIVYDTLGDLDRAEKMFVKALKIDEGLGRKEGMATAYGNLGIVYKTRGELGRAEQMHLKALEIDKKLGNMKGVARHSGNLAVVYMTRDDLDQAEEMHRNALRINEELGHKEGMASNYGNLGSIARRRGDAVKARELWTKSRDLFDEIGIPDKVERVQGSLDRLENDSDGDSGG
ncbi:MAG: tetratricopeptide (TPR) repeat protein [Planctomycetaceae bacterium]|jgi:tetratricopeptide (TPR) repeat protein